MFDLSSEGEITSFNKNFAGSVTLESNYDGIIVQSIGYDAFSNGKLVSIDMSQTSINTIQSRAFCDCHELQSVTFPNSLLTIGVNAFASCKITSIHIPASVTTIIGAFNQNLFLNTCIVDASNVAFASVNNFIFSKDLSTLYRSPINIEYEDIPHIEQVYNIQQYSFSGSQLSRFLASPNLMYVGNGVFHNCKKLSFVDYGLANITSAANFGSDHDFMKYLILPHRLKRIQTNAISGQKLIVLVIPSSLETIQNSAFNNLPSLSYIYILHSTIGFPNNVIFKDTPTTQIKCYVPAFYPDETFGGITVIRESYFHLIESLYLKCSNKPQEILFISFIQVFIISNIFLISSH